MKISADAKSRILGYLESSKQPYDSSDLILALYCFNRDDRTTASYRLLETVEAELTDKIPSMSPAQAISILQSYALAGRAQPRK